MKKSINLYSMLLLLISTSVQALPIDWSGSLGFDQNIIKNARGTTDDCNPATAGSQCVTKDNKHARFQSLLLRLNPSIIVNDSVTIKGEVSTGEFRGGFLGDDSNNDDSYFGQSNSGTAINFNQIYAELYADTALFRVGKYAKHFGLGAVINSGTKSWDRFFSGYQGVEAEFKLGNFKLIPAISKLDSDAGLPNGKHDTNEQSVIAMYDNSNSNLKLGVFYAMREVETKSDLYDNESTSHEMTIIDVFVEKVWERLTLGLEVPMLSGEVGTSFSDKTVDQDYDARAFILEASYELNQFWTIGINGGSVSGSDNDEKKQGAMYLHPNYQIAEIMFKYNLEGFQNSAENAFRSNITNANFAKFYTRYQSDAWTWRMDIIMAKANEAAQKGDDFYDHSSQTYQAANDDQEDDLGMEFDLAFDYKWSPSVTVSGYIGYYKVGEFYAFTNDTSEEIEVSDITASGMKINIGF